MTIETCPRRKQLSDYLEGQVPRSTADELTRHLEHCSQCQSRLHELESDLEWLIPHLRSTAGEDDYEQEPECQRVISTLETLHAIAERSLSGERIAPGARLNGYELLEQLGSGSRGTVYRAMAPGESRSVAVKVLSVEAFDLPSLMTRVHQARGRVQKLGPSAFVAVTHAGQTAEGTPFLVMESVDGVDLEQLVSRRGALAVSHACEIVRQTAFALEPVHECGHLHGELKPASVMLSADGTVRILNFGLTRPQPGLGIDRELTQSGRWPARIGYLAPEQFDPLEHAGPEADLYSLGCILSFLLTGQPPLPTRSFGGIARVVTPPSAESAPDIPPRRPEIPDGLAGLIECLLAKSPSERRIPGGSLAEALAPFADAKGLSDIASSTRGPLAGEPYPSFTSGVAENGATQEPDRNRPVESGATAALSRVDGCRSSATSLSRILRQPRWLWGLVGAVVLLCISVIVIVLQTSEGRLVLHVQPSDVSVMVSGDAGKIQVESPRGPMEMTLPPGRYRLEVRKGGFTTFTRKFEIRNNGTTEIEALLEPLDAKQPARSTSGDAPAEAEPKTPAAGPPSETVAAATPRIPQGEPPPLSPIEQFDREREVAEWILTKGGKVNAYQRSDIRRVEDLPLAPFHIQTVTLWNRGLDDDDVKILLDLARPQGFTVSKNALTNRSLEGLLKFKSLRWLYIGWNDLDDTHLPQISELKKLLSLDLGGTRVTDAGVLQINGLDLLREIRLPETAITDVSVEHLKRFPALVSVDLFATAVTDASLPHLRELPHLRRLRLDRTQITDAGLADLIEMKDLTDLNLEKTQVTPEGYEELRAALPKCNIVY